MELHPSIIRNLRTQWVKDVPAFLKKLEDGAAENTGSTPQTSPLTLHPNHTP